MQYTLEVIAGQTFYLDNPGETLGRRVWNRLSGATKFLYEGLHGDMIVFRQSGIMQSPLLFPPDSERIALPDVPGAVKIDRVDANKIQLTYTTP